MYRKKPNNYHDIYFLMIEYQSTYSPKNVIHYLTVSARLSSRQFAHVLWIISPEICLHIIIQFNCIITKLTADYSLVLSLMILWRRSGWSLDFFALILKSKWQIDSNGFRSMSSHDFEIYWDSQAKINMIGNPYDYISQVHVFTQQCMYRNKISILLFLY